MSEKDAPNMDEQRIEAALADELDDVAPRRDLWPSIQAEVHPQQPKPRRRWLVPAFGSVAILGSLVFLGSAAAVIVLFTYGIGAPGGGGGRACGYAGASGYRHTSGRSHAAFRWWNSYRGNCQHSPKATVLNVKRNDQRLPKSGRARVSDT